MKTKLYRNGEIVATYTQSEIDENRKTWKEIAEYGEDENAESMAKATDDELLDDLMARQYLDVSPGIYRIELIQ